MPINKLIDKMAQCTLPKEIRITVKSGADYFLCPAIFQEFFLFFA